MRVPKAAEIVAANLRERIVRGDVREGDFLSHEAALCAQFGVSRPVLREALRILEWESLIRLRRGARGGVEARAPKLRVASRSFGIFLQSRGVTVGNFFRTRLALEPLAARLLAENDDGRGAKQLEALIDEERGALRDPRRFSRLTLRFHEEILRHCGDPILGAIGTLLRHVIEEEVEVDLARYLEKIEKNKKALRKAIRDAYRANLRLAKLVRERKAGAAESHWRAYVRTLGRYLPRKADTMRINVLGDTALGKGDA